MDEGTSGCSDSWEEAETETMMPFSRVDGCNCDGACDIGAVAGCCIVACCGVSADVGTDA